MTIQIVPTTADPYRTQTTTLEGTTFQLYFGFNARCASWYLSIADASGVDIYNGMKLLCNQRLLRKCSDPRKPAGDFVVMSATPDLSPPGLGDLIIPGGRCSLYYFTSDWIALIESGHGQQLLAQLAANTQNATESAYGAR